MPQLISRRTPAALVVLLLFILPLLVYAPASAAAQSTEGAPAVRRAHARKLLRIADAASRRLAQAGQERLGGEARARPFREALVRMDSDIRRVGEGLAARELSFFQALRSGTATLAELQVTWALAGVRDAAIDQDLRILAAAYGRLRHRYGPEWLRYRSGRPLSETERLRFERMRAEQARLAGRLERLRESAEESGDTATADELALILVQVNGVVAAAPTPTLGDVLDASVASDSIRGAWYGARSTHAADEPDWAAADEIVAEITTDASVGFVFTTDLSAVQDWSFTEVETEIPRELAERETGPGGEAVLLQWEEPAETGLRTEELPAEEAEEVPEEAEEIPEETPDAELLVEEVLPEEDLAGEAPPPADEIEEEEIEEEDLDVESPSPPPGAARDPAPHPAPPPPPAMG